MWDSGFFKRAEGGWFGVVKSCIHEDSCFSDLIYVNGIQSGAIQLGNECVSLKIIHSFSRSSHVPVAVAVLLVRRGVGAKIALKWFAFLGRKVCWTEQEFSRAFLSNTFPQ